MSYSQSGHYQRSSQQQQGYIDQYGQYQQPTQNGSYQQQQQQQYGQQQERTQQNQHSIQSTYSHYPQGGEVQQPPSGYGYHQDQYQSPRLGSYAASQPAYNPQDYHHQSLPGAQQSQSYNPAAYAGFNQSPYPQQYNPAAYPEAPSHSTSGPVDPYAYASQAAYAPPSTTSPYQPSFSPQPQSQYSPQPPAHQYAYRHTQSPPPPRPTHYSSYQPPPLPPRAQSIGTAYPAEGARPHSGSISWSRQPANTVAGAANDQHWAPSPPVYAGSSTHYSPNMLPSPQNSPPGPTPPAHGPSRSNTLDRHPQERPLPPQPEPDFGHDYFQTSTRNRPQTGQSLDSEPGPSQDDLFNDLEGMLGQGTRSPSISISHVPAQSPPFSASRESRASRNGTVNGHLSPVVPQHGSHDAQYSSESDAEAALGNELMREAAEEEARRQSGGSQIRFTGLGSHRSSQQQQQQQQQQASASDSDDYGNVDMSSFGGGYDVPMTYGGDPAQLAVGGEMNGELYNQAISSQHSSMRRSRTSQSSQTSRQSYDYRMDNMHPFPPFNPAARVEVGGTGGLSEPTGNGRRHSFDEGDEYSLMDSSLPERFPDEPPEIFFQQATSSYPSRPLPAVPSSEHQPPPLQTEVKTLPPLPDPAHPDGPDAYMINAQGQIVPRSTSLVNHSNTPQVAQPLRSKTDAEDRRLRQQQGRISVYGSLDATPASASVVVDLPAIGKRFAPAKLGGPDFKKCSEPWSLMSLLKWLLQITNPEHTTELKEADIKEALVALFTNKVPTMNIADAEGLSSRVVEDMYAAGTLVTTEEWVKLVPRPISGVIFQLTQSGCYSSRVHDHVIPNMRCYSHLCQRTLKKVNLLTATTRSDESWATFYHLKKETIESRDKKEVERQNVLHEIVTSEEKFMRDLDILRVVYRDALMTIEPSVIAPKRKDKFIQEVFGRVEELKKANEEHLLPQLKYRQQEQGPWLVGFSDIFRQWIRKAKAAYVNFATDFPHADYLVRQELEGNVEFKTFANRAQNDKRSERHALDNYLKAPIARLQRYGLLLNSVYKLMREDSQEKTNLRIAEEEVRAATFECNARVAEMQRKVDLRDLQRKLVLRPTMQKEVELNLDHFGRQLIHRGDLQRMGSNRFTWLDCHALLFDHYLILAKTVAQRFSEGEKMDRYDVSRMPIPMDLLILESANDPPVQRSNAIRGLTTVREAAAAKPSPSDPLGLGWAPTNPSPTPGSLQHTNTAASGNSLHTVNSQGEGKDSDRILYPFRVKHLGRDTYTLFALTEQARKDWTTKITEAKTKHAAALFAQNAEPFKLRVMADSAFVYDAFAGSGKGMVIKGTPVDRAIKEVELQYKATGRPGPICRARVNCATSFVAPVSNKQMVAVGTEYGVYISEKENPRGWTKAIQMQRVTQVAVLEDFNLFLLISDKSLIAYHLDVVCPNEHRGPTPANDSARKAPQKLSGSKDVGFFVTGKMKERTLVFYKKKENLNSVFKVLEPVYQKSTERKRTGLFKRGNTEFFREYDEFYIPTECTGMNLFQSSLAVSTSKGFEVLTLDKKQPWTVPELRADHVQNIAQHIKDQRTISMLRLSDQEFLLCYGNCAVYVNKHGDVSRSVIMDFVGNAQHAALYGPFLVLFNEDFVEIRNAQNGRLKQIIAGREIKCLDDGTNWSANGPPPPTNGAINGIGPDAGRTLKLVMQHPEQEKTQIVVELLLNENLRE